MPLEVELWRTSEAVAPPLVTGVRGKLVGDAVSGLVVRIAHQDAAFDRHTRSDQSGEFLFLTPGTLAPNPAGRVPLKIEVRTPDGVLRPVAEGHFSPPGSGPDFILASFTVAPNTVSRILFTLT